MHAWPRPDDSVAPLRHPTTPGERREAVTLVAALSAVASVLVYRSVLGAYFWNDDFTWLYLLHDRSLVEVLLTPLGGHTLVARNAVFALTDALAGFDPRLYFATMLLTHAVNVALLAVLIVRWTDRISIAGIGAFAWGACPAASETLGWYSVYGQVAATTCILLALHRVASVARGTGVFARRDLMVMTAWLGLSSLFFGTGTAIALAWPVAIGLLLPPSRATLVTVVALVAVSTMVLAIYASLQLTARLLYAAPVIPADVLRWLSKRPVDAAVTFGHLVRVGTASLLLGAWYPSAARPDALSWLTVVAGAGFWLGAIAIAPHRDRATMLAFALLALAVYATVAIARGPVDANLFGMAGGEVAAHLRYHYAAQALLTVSFAIALNAILARRSGSFADVAVPTAWAAVLVVGILVRGIPVDRHDASRAETGRALAALHAQIALGQPGETVYVRNAPVPVFGWMPNTLQFPPGLAALFVVTSRRDEIEGRRVRFLEPDAAVVDAFARAGHRTARLLVSAPAGNSVSRPKTQSRGGDLVTEGRRAGKTPGQIAA
jgi:hypothetical protein